MKIIFDSAEQKKIILDSLSHDAEICPSRIGLTDLYACGPYNPPCECCWEQAVEMEVVR